MAAAAAATKTLVGQKKTRQLTVKLSYYKVLLLHILCCSFASMDSKLIQMETSKAHMKVTVPLFCEGVQLDGQSWYEFVYTQKQMWKMKFENDVYYWSKDNRLDEC